MTKTTIKEKTMKRTIITAALLAMVLVSCKKENQAEERVEMSVGVTAAAATKATISGTDGENAVDGIQVFVYKKAGNDLIYETAAKAEASSVNISVTTGAKGLLALVNCKNTLTDIMERSSVLGSESYLKDNTPTHFEMAGEASESIDRNTGGVSVPVNRLAARIRLLKITNEMENGYENKEVRLCRVFLTGAGACVKYSGVIPSTGLYATNGTNTMLDLGGNKVTDGAEKAAVNALIYKSIGETAIAHGASWQNGVSLYAYPNDGSARKTHMVAEMKIDGRFYTYPIELDSVRGNCTYEITELVLKSLGNPSNGDDILDPGEDDPIVKTTASFSVDVLPWTEQAVSNGEDGKMTI